MKKYVKPEIIIENFELSQQIASCDYDLKENTFSDVDCAFVGNYENTGIFVTIFQNPSVCEVPADGYCYHGSTSGPYSIFNS